MFDLDLYLQRIRLAERPNADAEGLAILQRAHRMAIPFENLDVALGRPIHIDSARVFGKLVIGGRGGYCFEHGQLFLDALAALGFEARPLLGRVWLEAGEHVPPLTHTLALVTIDGQEWIADTGFGASYAPPMPLVDQEAAEAPDGALYRLARDPVFGWMLSRNGSPGTTDGRTDRQATTGWQRQYSLTTEPVFPADLALCNYWISTHPESRFVQRRIVTIPLPHGFASLVDNLYKRRNAEQATEAEIGDPRVYRMRLSMMFGIDLEPEEVAALWPAEAV